MSNHSHNYYVYFLLCTILISGCYKAPSFADNETINVTIGKSKSTTVKVNDWSQQTQLVLVPGGPYLKNSFPLSHPASFLSKAGQNVLVVDKLNNLSLLDFSKHPATQITQLNLTDLVTAFVSYKQYVVVGYKQQGIAIYDTSNPSALKLLAQFDHPVSVTQIKFYNDTIYALSNNKQLWAFKYAKSDNSQGSWQHTQTIDLPAPSIDFAVLDSHVLAIGPEFGLGALKISAQGKFSSTYKFQSKAKAITIYAGIAYVASGSGGLTLFEINNPGQPQWVGSHNKFDAIDDVFISADRAYINDRGIRVATLNVANKTLPITGSFYKPESKVADIFIENNTAYLATEKGIEEVYFPTHTHAQISNEGINQGGTRRAYVDNDIAYVADWFSGLHLYDISNPTHPRHLSNYHTPGSSKGVVVENGYAYVGDDDHGLQIIDISNPERPTKVSEILTTGLAYTLKKRNNLIYLADHRGGFHIIDVSNVQQPGIVSSYNTPGKSWAIDVVDNFAYVADDTSGLLVFDVSNAKQPKQVAQFNPQGAAEDVVVKDHLAYVSFFDKGLFILDIRIPSQPRVVSQLAIPGNARSIVLADNYAYIAGWESGLNIVDISNPESPQIVGNYDTKGSAWGADVSKGHAFIWDWWGGVKVVNVERPNQPHLVGKYHTRGNIINLRQKDKYIYTANANGGVQVFDIKNALNPIWVTGADFPGKVIDIWPSARNGFAYAANAEYGLRILDISNPFYIQPVNQQQTGGDTILVRESKNIVYVAIQPSGLQIYNANNPKQLVKLQEIPVSVLDMQIHNNQLLVVSKDTGLGFYAIGEDGKLSEESVLIDKQASRVISNESLIISSNQNKVTIWKPTDNAYLSVAYIDLEEAVIDLQATEHELLVSTHNNGLLTYTITDPAQPVLQSRYPSTEILGRFIVHGDAVFFGGSHTIASAQRLPPLNWQPLNRTEIQLTTPESLAIGVYHLMLDDSRGNSQLWPNAINVSFPQRKKPKITMDDFEKLLEKHRSQQP